MNPHPTAQLAKHHKSLHIVPYKRTAIVIIQLKYYHMLDTSVEAQTDD